jgi:hypothetical protein
MKPEQFKVVKSSTETELSAPIKKPGKFSLDKFRSTEAPTVAGVETLQGPLSVLKMSEAKDFVRLHPDEARYWTYELCFVIVPIKGQKKDTLHLILEDLGKRFLESDRILRFRLALASKPHDVFFLCKVPSRNLDNTWNASALRACEQAKTLWTQATSRKEENVEEYKINKARDADAFPEPSWPSQSMDEMIDVTFTGRMIDSEDHPALLRLIGAKQSLS